MLTEFFLRILEVMVVSLLSYDVGAERMNRFASDSSISSLEQSWEVDLSLSYCLVQQIQLTVRGLGEWWFGCVVS